MSRQQITNRVLHSLQRAGLYQVLAAIIYVVYRIKGKSVKHVSFIRDLNVWEFEVGNAFYYSTGPGWSYDDDYLLNQFHANLGYFYLPKEGDIVIDVGAGVGEEMFVLSKLVGPRGKVLAVEAHPVTFKALLLNKEKNKLDNVILINKAISDKPGFLFIQNVENSLANKIMTGGDIESFKVDSITLDSLVELYELDRVDFVKVNIEGAEQLLVKGLNKALKKILRIAISCHDFRYYAEGDEFFRTKEIILSFLREHKYSVRLRETKISLLDDYVYGTSPQLITE